MPVIEAEGLRKRYGETVAVADVSFEVEEGEIFGILGPNGAGKTTTVEMVAGLRTPDAGRVEVLGLDARRDRAPLREHVGVQLQAAALPEKLTVREALELYASFYARPADPRALAETLGLAGSLDRRFAALSGGQQQRLSIALALVGAPWVAILDELTTGLDPAARRDTWSLIEDVRAQGVTILLVTHVVEEAERLCDRVALIDGGRVVATGTPEAIAARGEGETRMHFRPSRPLDGALLAALPEVRGVDHDPGGLLHVTGTGEVLTAVTSLLAREGIVAEHLRVDQARLEDAIVALTQEGVA